MSDARWFEIDNVVASAVRHFSGAATIFATFPGTNDRYMAEMAFQHAMLAGHTSLEQALVRILELLQERPPTGARSHADLIARARSAFDNRPPILTGDIGVAADETRRFRSVAAHAYDNFDEARAVAAVASARVLASGLAAEIARLKGIVDP